MGEGEVKVTKTFVFGIIFKLVDGTLDMPDKNTSSKQHDVTLLSRKFVGAY